MKANRRAGQEGQVLILAGVVLILAFLLAAFAVGELASEQQHLARGAESDLPKLFREARDKMANTMSGLTYPTIDNATLLDRFNSTQLEVEQQARARSIQAVAVLVNASDPVAHHAEKANFTKAGSGCGSRDFDVVSYNGSRNYTGLGWDCGDDGIIWDPVQAKVTGILVELVMADSTARLEEAFALALN